jgi:hypothetical protein
VLKESDGTITGPGAQSQRFAGRFVVDRLKLEDCRGAVGTPDRNDPGDRTVRRRAVRRQRPQDEQRVRERRSDVKPRRRIRAPEPLVPRTKLTWHVHEPKLHRTCSCLA